VKVWVIALNTFREAVRNKLLYALLVIAVVLIASGMAMGRLALDQEARILQDFGMFFLGLFGPVIAVFVGVGLLYDEIRRRTILVLLAKPVRRAELVLGKYLGMGITLLVALGVMSAAWLFLLVLNEVPVSVVHAQVLLYAFVEVMVVAAVAVFFSAFSTPYLSGMFTFGIFVLGRLEGQLSGFLPKVEPAALRWLAWVTSWFLPELHRFDLTAEVAHARPVGLETLLLTSTYGVTWAAIVLVLAVLIFARRDFL